MAPTGNTAIVNDFIGAGYVVDRADAVVIRKSGENEAYNIYWKYGHDATSAVQIKISRSHFTKNKLSIEKMERRDYRLHVGQKIGIVVYRDFVVTAEDIGMQKNSLSNDYLRGIYGYENRVNVYTGQTTHVSPNGTIMPLNTI